MTFARYRGVVLAALFLIVGSPVVMVWSWETDRVYQCTTRGGTFDYQTMSCDMARGEHPFASFSERHPLFVAANFVIGLVTLGAGLIATRHPGPS